MKTALALLFFSSLSLAQIPGMDMALIEKWGNAKVVKYQITGIHNARTKIIKGDHEGKADVTDKITIEFAYNKKKSEIIGEPKVTDFPSTLANIKADGTNCPPPQLKGTYDHFTMTKVTVSNRNQIQIAGTQTFADASVSQYPASCSFAPVAGGKVERNLFLTVIEGDILGMPMPKENKAMTISPDKKSITVQGADNWFWTYTPTIVQ